MRVTTLDFKKLSPEEAAEQNTRINASVQKQSKAIRRAKELAAATEALRKTQNATQRKRESRGRMYEREIEKGLREPNGKPIKKTVNNIPHLHCQTRVKKNAKASHIGKRRIKKLVKHQMNWQTHFVWIRIDAATKTVGWRPADIIRYLQLSDGGNTMFQPLRASVLRRWITTNEFGYSCWSPRTMEHVERGGIGGCEGRSRILTAFPEVIAGAVEQLTAMRETGILVGTSMARAVILAHSRRANSPKLNAFSFSENWVRIFLHQQLGWSMRKTTRAAKKVPPDWEVLCSRTHALLTWTIKADAIGHPDMIVNADQTGQGLIPMGNMTWKVRGAKQVTGTNHEEKRQTTLTIASTPGGMLLPIQSIWGGSTERSLPSKEADRRAKADKVGFTYGHGDKRHWSSLEITKEWVINTLVPHLNRVKIPENLPMDSKAVLLIDIWPVHIAKLGPKCFLPWLKENYPWIHPIFIPGGCTGLFQPADVGLQRPAKHVIKQSALDYFAGYASRKLSEGVAPKDIKLPVTLPSPRDASIAWTLEAYNHFHQNPKIVRNAWMKLEVGELNLSWACLTSELAMDHVKELLKTDEIFQAGFGSKDAMIPRSSVARYNNKNIEMPTVTYDDSFDDSSVPAAEVNVAVEDTIIEVPLKEAANNFEPNPDVEDEDNDVDPESGDSDVEEGGRKDDEETTSHGPEDGTEVSTLEQLQVDNDENIDGPGHGDEYNWPPFLHDPSSGNGVTVSMEELEVKISEQADVNRANEDTLGVVTHKKPGSHADADSNTTTLSPPPSPRTVLPALSTIALDIAVLGASGSTNPAALLSPGKTKSVAKKTRKPREPRAPKKPSKKVAAVSKSQKNKAVIPGETGELPLSLRRSRKEVHAPQAFGDEASDHDTDEDKDLDDRPKSRKHRRKAL